MKIRIFRKLNHKCFSYTTDTGKNILGTAYHKHFFISRMTVSYDDNTIELEQRNWLLILINSIPLLNLGTYTPYNLYVNKKHIGFSRNNPFKPMFVFFIEGDCYELCQHNNNYISLMKNNIQVGLYKKSDISVLEENIYELSYSDSMGEQLPLLVLFCVFADRIFYKNHLSFSYYKYEKNIVAEKKETYSKRTSWTPDS